MIPTSTPIPTIRKNLRRLAIGLLSLAALGLSSLAGAADLYYLHTDHLDTPRVVTDAQNTVVWRNDPLAEPFGLAPPDEDPDGDGQAFTFHLRFPGQYHDPETNTHYNVFRDYDPATGRYIQSDPIGLEGGINTYGYVGGNPMSRVDPTGELFFIPAIVAACEACPVCCVATVGAVANMCMPKSKAKNPDPLDPSGNAGHSTGARPSTGEKHEDGDARRRRDRGGEDGDDRRDWPRRPPNGWKGPWPPSK